MGYHSFFAQMRILSTANFTRQGTFRKINLLGNLIIRNSKILHENLRYFEVLAVSLILLHIVVAILLLLVDSKDPSLRSDSGKIE